MNLMLDIMTVRYVASRDQLRFILDKRTTSRRKMSSVFFPSELKPIENFDIKLLLFISNLGFPQGSPPTTFQTNEDNIHICEKALITMEVIWIKLV